MDTFFKKNYEHIIKQDNLLSSVKKKIGQDRKADRLILDWLSNEKKDREHLPIRMKEKQ